MSTGLDVVDLRARYGAVEALHGVSVSFPLGTTVALLGRNGAGKSSLFQAIAGSLAVTSGRICLDGRDITRAPTRHRVGAGLTAIPAGANVFARMSVADNLTLFGRGAAVAPVFETFPELAAKGEQLAGTLSGGERQMLALAPLLLRPGAVILLDEVTAGLAAAVRTRLAALIASLAGPERVIVIAEQYRSEITRGADLVYVLSRGELAWAGEPVELAGAAPAGLS